MQKDTTIKPYFHFSSKNDAVVIDSQYTYEGNYLAVSTSNASIIIYKSPTEQAVLDETNWSPVV